MLSCSPCNDLQYIFFNLSLAADQCLYMHILGIKIQRQAADKRHSGVSVTKASSAWCAGCCGLVTKDSTKRFEGHLQIISTITLPLDLARIKLQGLISVSLGPGRLFHRHSLWKEG